MLRWLRAGGLGPWSAVRGVRVVRVVDVAAKRNALAQHRSQVEQRPDGSQVIDRRVTRRFLGRRELFRTLAPPPAGPTMAGWVLPEHVT